MNGAGNCSLTIHKWHRGTFNGHQLMPADGMPVSLPSEGLHTLMHHPACEAHFKLLRSPGWQLITVLIFKPRLDSLEVSVHTSMPSCQPSKEVLSSLQMLTLLFWVPLLDYLSTAVEKFQLSVSSLREICAQSYQSLVDRLINLNWWSITCRLVW